MSANQRLPLLCLSLVLVGALPLRAQCADWSVGLGGPGFDGSVRALCLHDDGQGPRLYAAGMFETAGPLAASHIARFDGQRWEPVGSGIGTTVNALCEFDFGAGPRLVAGGAFASAGGVSAKRVAQWDGLSWAPIGLGISEPSGRVQALTAFDSGQGLELYAAGKLGTGHVRRFRAGAWQVVGNTLDNEVLAIEVFDDGNGPKLYAGGRFSARVARLDGATWTPLPGLVDSVWDLEVFQPSVGPAQLYACNDGFGQGVHRLLGTSWSNLGVTSAFSLRSGAWGGIPSLWIGGSSELRRYDGIQMSTFALTDAPIEAIGSFDLGTGERLWIGGEFERLDGAHCNSIAAFDGALWDVGGTFEGLDAAATVFDIVEWHDPNAPRNSVFAVGSFESIAGQPTDSVAEHDGSQWHAITGFPGMLPVRRAVTARHADWAQTRLLAANWWRVYTWDRNQWEALPAFQAVPGFNVHDVGAFPSPALGADLVYAAGTGLKFGDKNLGAMALWDGTNWVAPMAGAVVTGTARASAVFDPPGPAGPLLYLVGSQLSCAAAGISNCNIVAWNGTSFENVPVEPNANAPITSVSVNVDDSGNSVLDVIRSTSVLRFDGVSWSVLFSSASTYLEKVVGFDDGSGYALYLGGHQRLVNGTLQDFSGTFSSGVHAVVPLSSRSALGRCLVFGGAFERVGSCMSLALARWNDPCSALTSYCTGKLNSAGCVPTMQWSGTPSPSAASFVVSATEVVNQKSGLFFYSIWGRNAVSYQGGTICVRSPVARTPVTSSGGSPVGTDCSGVLSLDFAPWLDGLPNAHVQVGRTVNGQWWYRDPLAQGTTGFSNAIEFEVLP